MMQIAKIISRGVSRINPMLWAGVLLVISLCLFFPALAIGGRPVHVILTSTTLVLVGTLLSGLMNHLISEQHTEFNIDALRKKIKRRMSSGLYWCPTCKGFITPFFRNTAIRGAEDYQCGICGFQEYFASRCDVCNKDTAPERLIDVGAYEICPDCAKKQIEN